MDSNINRSTSAQEIALYAIRIIKITDATRLHRTLWSDRSLSYVKDHLKRLIDAIDKERGVCIVVEASPTQQLIGYGQIMRMGRCYEISDLIVNEQWRSHGIGSAMIGYLIKQIQKQSDLPIEIGVSATNTRALALYQRLGFEKHYQRKLNLGNGEETVLYLTWERKNGLN